MSHPRSFAISNEEVADVLDRVADLLAAQHASSYRVRAYHRGAETCRGLDVPLSMVDHLDKLPGIGKSLAAAITEYLRSGRLLLLERLEGQVSPEALFATIPAIGEELAHRIHETLQVETLEELELAAHDGRLATVPGFGARRVQGVSAALEVLLHRSTRRRARLMRAQDLAEDFPPPTVAALLEVDHEYRAKAEAGELRLIAPRRFNPEGEAWLPIYHTEKKDWQCTALFSNSARAHQLDKTRDWVVIFYERDGLEAQCTAVTEYRGENRGKRVIRGRESEGARAVGVM